MVTNFYNLIIENGGEVKRDDRCDGFGELCHHSCCFFLASIAARKQRTLWFCIAMWTVYTRSPDASRAFMELVCSLLSSSFRLLHPHLPPWLFLSSSLQRLGCGKENASAFCCVCQQDHDPRIQACFQK